MERDIVIEVEKRIIDTSEVRVDPYELEQWDGQIDVGSTNIFLAPRLSGKSHLARHLILKNMHKFDRIYVMTGSMSNDFYQGFIDTEDGHLILNELDTDRLFRLRDLQDKFKKERGRMLSYLIILDDMVDKGRNAEAIRDIFALGRHRKITIFCIIQAMKYLAPDHYNNCDRVFILRQKQQELKLICERILSTPDLPEHLELSSNAKTVAFLSRLVKKNTVDYGVVTINNRCNSNCLYAMVTKYKAPEMIES